MMRSAEVLLRSVVFAQWRASQCESYEDTAKLMSLIDVFLPYLPLERAHMPALVGLALRDRAALLAQRQRRVVLQWEPGVAEFIAGQVCVVRVGRRGGRWEAQQRRSNTCGG
jgi:hypothetical protein